MKSERRGRKAFAAKTEFLGPFQNLIAKMQLSCFFDLFRYCHPTVKREYKRYTALRMPVSVGMICKLRTNKKIDAQDKVASLLV